MALGIICPRGNLHSVVFCANGDNPLIPVFDIAHWIWLIDFYSSPLGNISGDYPMGKNQ